MKFFILKLNVGIFLGYAPKSKAYRVFNKRTLVVEESINVTIDESNVVLPKNVTIRDNEEEYVDEPNVLHIKELSTIEAPKEQYEKVDETNKDLPKV